MRAASGGILAVAVLALAGLAAFDYREAAALRRLQPPLAAVQARIDAAEDLQRTLLRRRGVANAARIELQNRMQWRELGDPAMQDKAKELLLRLDIMQGWLEKHPELAIPELRLLQDKDWILVAERAGDLKSEDELRAALANAREAATGDFAHQLQQALKRYLAGSQNVLPADVTQLTSYFDGPVDPAMLARYQMLRSGTVDPNGGVSSSTVMIGLQPSALADPIYDRVDSFTTNGWLSFPDVDRSAVNAAAEAYKNSHGGQNFGRAEDLVPYFPNPTEGQRFLAIAKAQHLFGSP